MSANSSLSAKPPRRRFDWPQALVMAACGGLAWAALFWSCRNTPRDDPDAIRATAVTGCGELVVGEVTVALRGVDIHDCAGANAWVQTRVVDAAARLHVLRGHCRLVEPATAPAWECVHGSGGLGRPEREPPHTGPLGEARTLAWVDFHSPRGEFRGLQQALVGAGVARVSATCMAELEQAMADPRLRWPGACASLWQDQCNHDHAREVDVRLACMDRFHDPAAGSSR